MLGLHPIASSPLATLTATPQRIAASVTASASGSTLLTTAITGAVSLAATAAVALVLCGARLIWCGHRSHPHANRRREERQRDGNRRRWQQRATAVCSNGKLQGMAAAAFGCGTRGDNSMRAALFIVFTVFGVVLSLVLGGCTPAMTIQQRSVDGIPYTMFIDHPDPPCGTRSHNEGCYIRRGDNSKEIYVSSIAPLWVVVHEIAHVQGMKHTEWRETPNGWCAFVIQGGGQYSRGDIICNNAVRERIIAFGSY